ncbi:hypothetical protein AURDEDRAFT_72744 [Auricularia subglabra TFB-10046 SS5]|uniref:EXPERA domain-containing protein n=1 Tax=Auricularia subglabra (strain TFB-10046 / SS5) TaxID=717982 RepID=J0D0J5_AURST|nr:hypothetical protein AURDEDRAFT_72744 [Auricularia subglabra TFB-10046 SS5]
MAKTATKNATGVPAAGWISAWFLFSAPIILWDASYCLMRPRSMRGGDLHWIWRPYSIYQDMDLVYGLKALEENDGFPSAQSFMNLVETALNLLYVYKTHVNPSPAAPIIGLSSAVMTISKTVLYWTQEYYCNFCAVGHNSVGLLLLWIILNGTWLVIPTFVILRLSKDITRSLSVAAGVKSQ